MPGEISPHLAPLPTLSFSTGGFHPQVPGSACFPSPWGGRAPIPRDDRWGLHCCCLHGRPGQYILYLPQASEHRSCHPASHIPPADGYLAVLSDLPLTATPTFPLVALGPGDPSARPRCTSDLVGYEMLPSAHAWTPHLSVRTPDRSPIRCGGYILAGLSIQPAGHEERLHKLCIHWQGIF